MRPPIVAQETAKPPTSSTSTSVRSAEHRGELWPREAVLELIAVVLPDQRQGDHQAARGPQHALQFRRCRLRIGQVEKPLREKHEVERRVLKRQEFLAGHVSAPVVVIDVEPGHTRARWEQILVRSRAAEDELELLRTFNCGIGMIAIVRPDAIEQVTAILTEAGESVALLGEVIPAEGEHRVVYNGHLDLHGKIFTW